MIIQSVEYGIIDLGVVVKACGKSLDSLRLAVGNLEDAKKFQYLTSHFEPGTSKVLHSRHVTKGGKTWKVSFQHQWFKQFPWLCYSDMLSGGLCRYCVLFPESPTRVSNYRS